MSEFINRLSIAVSVANQPGASADITERMHALIDNLRKAGIVVVQKDRFKLLERLARAVLQILPETGEVISDTYYSGDNWEVSGELILKPLADLGLMFKTPHGYVPSPELIEFLKENS